MGNWPDHLPVARVRYARATDQFDAIVAFYRDAVGLPVIGGFEGHDNYQGIMFGLPDDDVQLEISAHDHTPAERAPNRDTLLVLYVDNNEAIAAFTARMAEYGHQPVTPENPYWTLGGVTFEDPDGYGFILMNMNERRRLLTES